MGTGLYFHHGYKNIMKKYKIIYADPPWQYNDKSLNKGGAERYYNTVSNTYLCNIDVQSVCEDDCVLFMWATFPKIKEALELMDSWGFEYKTNAFTWVKKNKIKDPWFWGMGGWTRSNAEICLLGVKGKPQRVGKGVHSVIDAPIMEHSKKPDIVRDKIVELLGDVPRLEMFARQTFIGWDVFSNEISETIKLNNKVSFL